MSTARNWQKAREREQRLGAAIREHERAAREDNAPGRPPSCRQIAKLAQLSRELGEQHEPRPTMRATSHVITGLKLKLDVVRRITAELQEQSPPARQNAVTRTG